MELLTDFVDVPLRLVMGLFWYIQKEMIMICMKVKKSQFVLL